MSVAIGNSFPIRKMEVAALFLLSLSHFLFPIQLVARSRSVSSFYICVILSLSLLALISEVQRQLNSWNYDNNFIMSRSPRVCVCVCVCLSVS